MSIFVRHASNPLITPDHLRPFNAGYEIIGTFNAGAALLGEETILLVRVAERPLDTDEGWIACPYANDHGEIQIRHVRVDDPEFDTRDPRFVRHRQTGIVYLTSISHLRLMRSADGVHFTGGETAWLKPETGCESFGVEDARITLLNGVYHVNYSAVSEHGIATGLLSTTDFRTITRQGIIFPPSNRDVAIFPQQINGLYACYHRPMPGEFGHYSIWSATSPNLIHWGNHQLVLRGSSDGWDAGRVGGGAPPVWTEKGWLSIYHAADRQHRYCLGAFLSAHDDPARVIARTREPIFIPETDYETNGFFPNVVFTCGVTVVSGMVRLYYGASDDSIALAEAPLEALMCLLAG
ncbi:glycoside hydrolase family 130 protein [Kamptonema cortianum]|nr:glycoside hydrolase family 130 protein [Kamptonema cortianum]